MNYLGIEINIKNRPELDPDFIPLGVWMNEYLKEASRPIDIAIEREKGKISVFRGMLRDPSYEEANLRYIERFIKFLLWSVGGWKIYISGCEEEARKVKEAYVEGGTRGFDVWFMQSTYERPFEFEICDKVPEANESSVSVGGHLEGCRIGFDAGGSDRKVSAVIDGKTVYSEEVIWQPKLSADPTYQFNGIVDSFKTAASKMPRVDGIGVSSAGVFIGNAPMVSSLFVKVPEDRRDEVKTIYDRAALEIGDVPIVVANDGDVTALAGAMSLDTGCVMGIAMGTSEAGGYVDKDRNVLGWFNELAFAPVDLNEKAMADPWSGDLGVGATYFSQDSVIKLAPAAGITLDENLTPAEKLVVVQELMAAGDERAVKIYASIGAYMAHTIVLYSRFYDIKYLLVMGRVASGKGGELIISECNRILEEEYPDLADMFTVMLPDEKARRVGQSVAAASLPETR